MKLKVLVPEEEQKVAEPDFLKHDQEHLQLQPKEWFIPESGLQGEPVIWQIDLTPIN